MCLFKILIVSHLLLFIKVFLKTQHHLYNFVSKPIHRDTSHVSQKPVNESRYDFFFYNKQKGEEKKNS